MSKKNIILAITNGFWLIDEEYVLANSQLIQKVLSGESAFDVKETVISAMIVAKDGEVKFENRSSDIFNSATPGSTAVINITGPIMKYDNCGDPGTKTYKQLLSRAEANPNIGSVVLVADSPGGTVDGTQELANFVKNFSKPIVTLVDQLAASAMYWIGSQTNEIIALNETATIGSIGTMIAFADMQGKMEKEGIKFHFVRADASTDKNQEFLDARAGNYAALKLKLNAINDVFLADVKEGRGDKLDLKTENVLSGKTYLAEDALKFGLIDAIGSFEYAVSRAQALAETSSAQKKQSTQNLQNQNMKKLTLSASNVALLAVFGASIAEGQTSVDVELTDENLTALEGALATSSKASSDLDKAKADLVTANGTVETQATKITELEASIATLGKKNPGSTNTVKQGADVIIENDNPEAESELTPADAELAEKMKGLYGSK